MTVVKADGYGHGALKVAKVVAQEGINFLMVALLEEAISLRKGEVELPILVVGRVPPIYGMIAATHNITLTIFDKVWVEELKDLSFEQPLSVHLEFETGMNRTGISTEEQLKKTNTLKSLELIFILQLQMKSQLFSMNNKESAMKYY